MTSLYTQRWCDNFLQLSHKNVNANEKQPKNDGVNRLIVIIAITGRKNLDLRDTPLQPPSNHITKIILSHMIYTRLQVTAGDTKLPVLEPTLKIVLSHQRNRRQPRHVQYRYRYLVGTVLRSRSLSKKASLILFRTKTMIQGYSVSIMVPDNQKKMWYYSTISIF